jgi:uncharacterized membrane protein
MNFWIGLSAIALVMVIVDIPWLNISKPYWLKFLGSGAAPMRPLFGIPVYLAMAYLFTYATSITEAFFIGLAAYLIFDGTNAVIFGNYPLLLGAADTLWGGILFAVTFWLNKRFLKISF